MWDDNSTAEADNNSTQQSTQSMQPQQTSNDVKILQSLDSLNKIDQKFNDLYDNIVVNLNNYNLHSSAVQRIEIKDLADTLKSIKKDELTTISKENIEDDVNHLLNSSNNNILGNLGISTIPTERKERYDYYDEMQNINYIAYRMLKVYIDNILIKNNQTKQFLTITENDINSAIIKNLDKNITNQYKNFLKTFITYFDVQKKLKDKIIPKMLKYGNCYLEIINLSNISKIVEQESGLIQEDINIIFSDNASTVSVPANTLKIPFSYELSNSSNETLIQENALAFGIYNEEEDDTTNALDPNAQFKALLKNKALMEGTILEDSVFWQDEESNENTFDFNLSDITDINFKSIQDIHLNIINPHKVIPIESNEILFGYLIVDEDDSQADTEVDVYKRFINAGNGSKAASKDESKKVVDKITKNIVQKLKQVMQLKSTKKIADLELDDEIETSLKVLLYHKIKENSKLKFRFVSTNRIVDFHTNVDKYANHGTSIYDPITQPLKMYTLALMSSIVSRLSRASVVRRWIVEAGSKKNHPELIAKLKQDIASKAITFDSLSNIKNISNVITDYKDFATISVNGQRYVDMEVLPMGDRGLPVNDMQDLRNELIAATGIPSIYLNISDQADVRETLVNLNIGFANTISSYQDNIDDGINKALNIVFSILLENNGYKDNIINLSNYFKMNLNPPVILLLQSAEASISSVANISGMLTQMNFTTEPQTLLEQYIPQIDWAKLKKSGEAYIKEEGKKQLMQPDPTATSGDGSTGGGAGY